jgi:hypothetical protein
MLHRSLPHPVGVTLIAILLAIHGVLALLESFAFLGLPGGVLVAGLGILFGLALLSLAYAMWHVQPWSWLTTLDLNPAAIASWVGLILAVVII